MNALDLHPDELTQVEGVVSFAKSASGIGAGFLIYREYIKRRLPRSVADTLTPEEIRLRIDELGDASKPHVVRAMKTHIRALFITSVKESPAKMTKAYFDGLSTEYAEALHDYIHATSRDAALLSFQAQVNRGVNPKQALNNITAAYGVNRSTFNVLMTLWTEKPKQKLTSRKFSRTKQTDRVITQALNTRAQQISREESWNIKESGKAMSWRMARNQNVLGGEATRIWRTAKDERVCPVCGPMDGKGSALNRKFTLPNGNKVWSPPVHVSCRCSLELSTRSSSVRRKIKLSTRRFSKTFKEYEHRRSPDGRFRTKGPKPTTYKDRVRTYAAPAKDDVDLDAFFNSGKKALNEPVLRSNDSVFRSDEPVLRSDDVLRSNDVFHNDKVLNDSSNVVRTANVFRTEDPQPVLRNNNKTLRSNNEVFHEQSPLVSVRQSGVVRTEERSVLRDGKTENIFATIIPVEVVEEKAPMPREDGGIQTPMRADMQRLEKPLYAVTSRAEMKDGTGFEGTEFVEESDELDRHIAYAWTSLEEEIFGMTGSYSGSLVEESALSPIEIGYRGKWYRADDEAVGKAWEYALARYKNPAYYVEMMPDTFVEIEDEDGETIMVSLHQLSTVIGAIQYVEEQAPVLAELSVIDANKYEVMEYRGRTYIDTKAHVDLGEEFTVDDGHGMYQEFFTDDEMRRQRHDVYRANPLE